MAKTQSVISLDAIDRAKKHESGFIGRLLKTRWSGGKTPQKDKPYGHYLFCGRQGAGKTASALWYTEKLAKQSRKKGLKVQVYSNIGIGREIIKKELFKTIDELDSSQDEARIFIIDEIQSYFPRDGGTKKDKEMIGNLTAVFSQLRKRNVYILSTAQVYGRLDKSLREQCLFMVNCRKSKITGKFINEFIDGDDIICDDLGRWSGDASRIYVHGLSKLEYDTYKLIRN